MNDIEIQIHAITQKALQELNGKDSNEEYDLIVRDFSPAVRINLQETNDGETILDVFEEFVLDTPCAEGTFFHLNKKTLKKKLDYENTVAFLKDLKMVPVLDELIQSIGKDPLISWMKQKDRHIKFYDSLKEKHKHLFNHLDYETTVIELDNALKSAIERKYRSDTINYHIKDIKGIENKLLGVYDWHVNQSRKWYDKIKGFMPEYSPRGYQKVIVTEIAPMSRKNEFGEIGGKTIKIGRYEDIHIEISESQRDVLGEKIICINPQELKEIRELSLQMLVARRFIFDDAINKIYDFEKQNIGFDIPGLNEKNESFRMFMYASFVNNNQKNLYKIHKALNLIAK